MQKQITIRYFAAARAAAGTETETIDLLPGTTMMELIDGLKARDGGLAKVLARCSYLCDGVAVRDTGMTLGSTQTIDVLPPFAGG
ncbi:molybdopterin synthase sulfur carrier subunit [Mycolicibacterium cyprinidarum]|uniref:Molybdopterin synthase sulfur carrier subunit n=1 Tax=Mycolicibacterium cyprinidarum TaxID=2860311 RepID=A0ABQ4VDZ1_9MYCO|nr:molybdopterin synthase sulfur carrier subunit [Mycolicibacterium sp. NGTWS0302]GJF11146.1 molybdopterin synthase sulfur carrier subunit [Mycolicibacterium sp. NGTWS1803]GJF18632.1 molybdopterin synthase sulfur carrier subunit [Mycolicibacterium sp. NGTWSNA01]